MVKGFNRRVVVMKDTGSDIFDEAYFLIKENACTKGRKGPSAIEEAKRIVAGVGNKKRGGALRFFRSPAFCFLLGLAVGAVSVLIFF